VITIEPGALPTSIGSPGLLVAVAIGITVVPRPSKNAMAFSS
jgi:hypothetical protein